MKCGRNPVHRVDSAPAEHGAAAEGCFDMGQFITGSFGANMRAHNAPDAARFIRREPRQKWLF